MPAAQSHSSHVVPSRLLHSRVEALLADLSLAHRALESNSLDKDLRDRVRAVFEPLLQQRRTDLQQLADEVRRSDDGPGSERLWARFYKQSDLCGRQFREYLAFLEGSLIRSAGLDDGACKLADALLAELTERTRLPWRRFTILAEDEFVAGMSGIIRLRFPHLSLWNLSVVAHELGHLAARKIHDGMSGDPLLLEAIAELRQHLETELGRLGPEHASREAEAEELRLHELFADLFAVFTLGPSYACTCVLLRFDPCHAFERGPWHPSDAERVHFMLRALERLDSGHYRPTVNLLEESWRRCVVAAGQPDPAGWTSRHRWLDEVLDAMLPVLTRNLPEQARYQGWATRALPLQEALEQGRPLDEAFDCVLSDLLNAVWSCRLDAPDQAYILGRRAFLLAQDCI
jgi:hypothetical protein